MNAPGFGTDEAERYRKSRHGPDGAVLLDPHIQGFVERHCRTEVSVIDIGCGAGWLSVGAAVHGADVLALDLSEAMVTQAVAAVSAANLQERVTVEVGDARQLRFADDTFGVALSSNVGCTLDGPGLRRHLAEMARVLMPGGRGLISAPSSLGHVFLDEGEELRALAYLSILVLESATAADVIAKLKDEARFHRATVYWGGEHWQFTHLGITLPDGTPIFRKIPGLVVPNFWHETDAYEAAIAAAGLSIVERHADVLTRDRRLALNDGKQGRPGATLGKMYEMQPAFTVYVVEKSR